jgi:hypothetical protein
VDPGVFRRPIPARANGKRHWNQSGREASLVRNGSEKLLVRINARAAELEDCRMRLGSLHDSSNRFRNIFHIGRLQSGAAAAEHWIDWKLAKELEDGGEKRVVRSEHHRRTDVKRIGERCPDRQFAFAALSDVARGEAASAPIPDT